MAWWKWPEVTFSLCRQWSEFADFAGVKIAQLVSVLKGDDLAMLIHSGGHVRSEF
jgi:hypothetical protein